MSKQNKLVKPIVISLIVLGIAIPAGIFLIIPEFFGEDFIITKTKEEIIKEGIEAGLLEVPFECVIQSECEDGQPIISDPIDTNPIEEIIDPKPINSTDIIPELVCDPPAELVNEQCLLPEPPLVEPPKVELLSKIVKIDNNGTRFESQLNFIIPQLSFFVEDTTNLDFDNGFIENQLFIVTDPTIAVSGKGFFDIKIGNQTILTEPIQISVSGMSDPNGEIPILFVSPLGSTSDIFLFQFKENIDKFTTQGLTKIEYKISGLTLSANNFDFGIEDTIIFEMEIARDPNKIIITNEEGATLRVFPFDQVVSLCSSSSKYCYKQCWQRSVRFGCIKYRTVCQGIAPPLVGAWEFFKFDVDGKESLFESGASFTGACPLNIIVQRDEVYKIEVSSPTAGTVKWKSSEEQEKYRFNCVQGYDRTIGFTGTTCNFRPQDNQAFINSLEIVP